MAVNNGELPQIEENGNNEARQTQERSGGERLAAAIRGNGERFSNLMAAIRNVRDRNAGAVTDTDMAEADMLSGQLSDAGRAAEANSGGRKDTTRRVGKVRRGIAAGAALLATAGWLQNSSHTTVTEVPVQGQTTVTRTVEGPLVPQVTVDSTSVVVPAAYAEKFAADPNAKRILRPSDIPQIATDYENLVKKGDIDDGIQVKGNASADIGGEVNAGLTDPNQEENMGLAKERAVVVEQGLREELPTVGLEAPHFEPPIAHVSVLAPDSKEMADLTAVAKPYGSVERMVEMYDAGVALSPEAEALLDKALRDQRMDIVTVSGKHVTEPSRPTVTETETVTKLVPKTDENPPAVGGYQAYESPRPRIQRDKENTQTRQRVQQKPQYTPPARQIINQPNKPINGNNNKGRGYGVERGIRGAKNKRQTNSGRR